jgi:hypothetical protein
MDAATLSGTAIPVGSLMYIVEDPTRRDRVFPLVLAKVGIKALHFRCACGMKDCTRTYKFSATQAGYHPPIWKR